MLEVQKLSTTEVSTLLRSARANIAAPPPLEPQPVLDHGWLLDVLWRRSGIILGSILAGLVLSALYLLVTPPLYTASLRLLVESQTPRINDMQQLTPDLGPIDAAVLSQVEVLRSPRMAEQVIRHMKLHPSASIMAPDGSFAPLPADVIEAFSRRLSVNRIDPTSIIQVTYSHNDPQLAKTIANTMASLFLEDQVAAKNATTSRAVEWLKKRVKDLSEQVRVSANQLEAFKAEHNLHRLGQMTLGERVLSASSDQLIAARTAEAAALVRLQQMQRLTENPKELEKAGHALQSDTLREFRRQHAEITRRRANVISRFGTQHPDVANSDAELKALDRQIMLEMGRIIDSSRTEFEAAKAQVAMLEKNLSQVKDVLTEDNQFAIKLADLERQAQASSALYQTLLNRLKETESQESLNAPDARILNFASTPLSPTHPRKSLVLMLALLASAGLGLTMAFGSEVLAPAFWSSNDVERVLGYRYLAALPSLDPADRMLRPLRSFVGIARSGRARADRARSGLQQWLKPRGHVSRADANEPLSAATPLLRPVAGNDGSAFTEAVFTIKSAVEGFRAGRARTVIAVVSVRAGEGKTTVALNLADYLASSGTRTLLVDADLRDSELTRHLAPQATRGLASVVSEGGTLAAVAIRDAASGVSFLPATAGDSSSRPMDVLSSPKVAELLAEAANTFDVVLLDTAALSRFVDTRALLKVVDAVVVVIEHGTINQELVRSALRAAELPADRVLGVVLNKVS